MKKSFHRPEDRPRGRRRMTKLKITSLALTVAPAHGINQSVIKNMDGYEPAIKGKIFANEDKSELDLLGNRDIATLSNTSLGLESSAIADALEAGEINQEDAVTRLRELSDHVDNNTSVDDSDPKTMTAEEYETKFL